MTKIEPYGVLWGFPLHDDCFRGFIRVGRGDAGEPERIEGRRGEVNRRAILTYLRRTA